MTEPSEPNLAVFCDYENVALGARESSYGELDVELVIERLLEKGKVVLKKAYSDWSRYESAKRPVHDAAFELIEIPHVSYSGKNSADIRLVVDALDLCYAKSHIDAFVIAARPSGSCSRAAAPLARHVPRRDADRHLLGFSLPGPSPRRLREITQSENLSRDLRAGAERESSTNSRQTPHRGRLVHRSASGACFL